MLSRGRTEGSLQERTFHGRALFGFMEAKFPVLFQPCAMGFIPGGIMVYIYIYCVFGHLKFFLRLGNSTPKCITVSSPTVTM